MTRQTLKMWAKAKSIFFFCFHKKGHCIYFLHRTESNCVWSISVCLWETYLVVKSNFNGHFIQTLGRPAMSVGSTHIPPRHTNWTLLDVSTRQWADKGIVHTVVVWVNEITLSWVITSSCYVILTLPLDRCYFLSADHRCYEVCK